MERDFKADPRSRREVLEELERVARSLPTPPGQGPWVADLLRDISEPSAAVQAALAGRLSRVVQEYNKLPLRMRKRYFVDRLGIERRTPQADRAYVRLVGVTAQLPVQVPRGSVFVANEEDRTPMRRYVLRQGATVTGISLGAVLSYQRLEDGRDLVLERPIEDGQLRVTCRPFGSAKDADRSSVERMLFVESPHLRSACPGTTLRLRFDQVGPSVEAFLEGLSLLECHVTTTDGWLRVELADTRERPGDCIEVVMKIEAQVAPIDAGDEPAGREGGPRVRAGQVPAIRLTKPVSAATHYARDLGTVTSMCFASLALEFDGEGVQVTDALVNGHAVNLDEPFAPFGAPSLAGTMLHLACGSVFGLPLERLSLCFVSRYGDLRTDRLVELAGASAGLSESAPAVTWRRMRQGRWSPPSKLRFLRPLPTPWVTTGSLDRFGGQVEVGVGSSGMPFSAESTVGRSSGHYLQLALRRGDFGWEHYLAAQEEFVRQTARQAQPSLAGRLRGLLGRNAPAPEIPGRPEPPTLSSRIDQLGGDAEARGRWGGITASYRSLPVGVPDIRLWIGVGETTPKAQSEMTGSWLEGSDGTRRFRPFEFGRSDWGGELYVGFRGATGGLAVSVFVDVASLGEATGRSNGEVLFQYWSVKKRPGGDAQEGWRELEVRDDTLGLTQSGILRWRAPLDWLPPSNLEPFTLGRATGLSWLRIRVRKPSENLYLSRMVCDVSEVEYHGRGFGPADGGEIDRDDDGPAQPLPDGSRLIPEHALAGLMRAELVEASRDGAGPEALTAHLERAGRMTRHRRRAVTPRDVEWLVLDEFPSLHLVQCLRSSPGASPAAFPLPSPRVLVVPAHAGRLPLASVSMIQDVRVFLSRCASPAVEFSVADPDFDFVRVRVLVDCAPGRQPARVRDRVHEIITSRLVPAFRPRGGTREFSASIGIEDVARVVRSVRGVARIVRIAFDKPFDGETVACARPGRILTSAPDHMVNVQQIAHEVAP